MDPPPDPGHSSGEELEDEQWHSTEDQEQAVNLAGSATDSPAESGQPSKQALPMQKRRRVTRACDECRRKKIKCDGKQPCTHCTVYSYDCTYDQPSNRRRNPAPQYIEALETRLQKAEALLRTVLPNIDLDNPKFDACPPQQILANARRDIKPLHPPSDKATKPNAAGEGGDGNLLESMVENTGLLDIDDQGYWDYHGHSSGTAFMRRMRAQFGDSFVPDPRSFAKPRPLSIMLDSPKSVSESPMDTNLPPTQDLPPRDVAKELCRNALDEACALMRFVHQPTFYTMFDRIYDTNQENYGNAENKFLPLLYAVMATGCLFAKTENSTLDINGYEGAVEQGFLYFKASRQTIDITECRDLTSVQTVMFMIMFLQSSAKMSTCYSYVGIALRAALRLGLHRNIKLNFNPIELETRKRVFWVIRKMDIYVCAMLGLPQMLSYDDVDQEFPKEVDDDWITTTEILPMPEGKISMLVSTNAHTRLLMILQKVVKHIYPIKGLEDAASSASEQGYFVSHTKVREIEKDLQTWMEELPMALRPSDDSSRGLARVQQLLRISYAHVQMMMYRPFLHYVAGGCQQKGIDKRAYACAAAGVSVSRNIVHITAEMKKRGLLIGAYWFTMYTTYFATLMLVFFVLENPDSPTGRDILKDAMEGKDTLAGLAKRSMAADRCSQSLAGVFAELPDKLRDRQNSIPVSSTPSRKRNQPSAAFEDAKGASSSPNFTSTPEGEAFAGPTRASTFPNHATPNSLKRASGPPAAPKPTMTFDDNQLYNSPAPGMWNLGDTPGMVTPESLAAATASMNSEAVQSSLQSSPQQLSFGSQLNSNLPDFTAMMFPSADPFAYPNQPMSALEDGQFKQDPSVGFPNSNNMFYANGTPSSNISYENLAMPMFGSLPPFLMQQDQQPVSAGPMDNGHFHSMGTPTGTEPGSALNADPNYWQQACRPGQGGKAAGVNLDGLFGNEDWTSAWMGRGFQQ